MGGGGGGARGDGWRGAETVNEREMEAGAVFRHGVDHYNPLCIVTQPGHAAN